MRLQTSPYLTLARSGEPSPVVYMTDTIAPEYPDLSRTENDGAIAVVGLDRRAIWVTDADAVHLLQHAAPAPVATSELENRFGRQLVTEMVQRSWLQDPSDLCRDYWLRTGQIEVTSHCNWGCQYCPVARDPKPRETMPMDLFTEILDQLTPYKSIRFVTFHFFNEPTLDRYFEDRVTELAKRDMKLSLATNASALTSRKIELLKKTGVLHHLVVNLPALDAAAFSEYTGSRTYRASRRNLDEAIAAGFPVTLAVNGKGGQLKRNLSALAERYEPQGVEVRAPLTCDRAGTLDGQYAQKVSISGRLTGCSWPVNHAYFSVRGDLFICCNDYYQREVFGNIRDGSLHDVMTSPAAVRLRRRVFGVDLAPGDYICRSCHDQVRDFPHRQFRPIASFPVSVTGTSQNRYS